MDVNQTAPVQPLGQGGGHGGGTATGSGGKQQQDQEEKAFPKGHTDPAISVSGLLSMDGLSPEAQHALERMAAEIEPLRRQIEQTHAELEESRTREHQHSLFPGLNRRGFTASLDKLLHRLETTESRPALILVHLVNGDDIRRSQGRMVLDEALRKTFDVISSDDQQAMVTGCLGGNDFAMVVLEDGLDGARRKAEQITGALRATHTSSGLFLQAKVGVAILEPGMTPDAAIDAADRDLR